MPDNNWIEEELARIKAEEYSVEEELARIKAEIAYEEHVGRAFWANQFAEIAEIRRSVDELRTRIDGIGRSLQPERRDGQSVRLDLDEHAHDRIDDRAREVLSALVDRRVRGRFSGDANDTLGSRVNHAELDEKADRADLAKKADQAPLEEVKTNAESLGVSLQTLAVGVDLLEDDSPEQKEWRHLVIVERSADGSVLHVLNTTPVPVDLDDVVIVDHDEREHEVEDETIDAYSEKRIHADERYDVFAVEVARQATPLRIRFASGDERLLCWGTMDLAGP